MYLLILASRRCLCVLFATLLLSGCTSASSSVQSTVEENTESFVESTTAVLKIEHLLGRWHSTDNAFGQVARSQLQWHKALNDKFYRLNYQIEQKYQNVYSPYFSATAFYRTEKNGNYTASWVDSSANIFTVETTGNGKTLESIWRDNTRIRGKTQYTLIDENTLLVKDWVRTNTGWQSFNEQRYTRDSTLPNRVTGIGGFFFRGKEPSKLVTWYDHHFDISPTPSDYATPPWRQEAGSTVFAPFKHTTSYFGEQSQQWMINLRVRDMDALIQQLRAADIEVEVDPEIYPNGRFARLSDPEGNPIQLWEPAN